MAGHHRLDGVRLVELTPAFCPSGHPLGPHTVLVGTHPCLCAGLVHRIWRCVRCDRVLTWPACVDHRDWVAWSGEE